MNEFKIYPAIDLINGEVVRLAKGQFDQKTVYNRDPIAVAQSFAEQGATYLHVVDLDGAKACQVRQSELIAKIAAATTLKLQVGGGVRSASDVKNLLDQGVDRVVIGSLAVKQPEVTEGLFKEFGGDRLTLGLDVQLDAKGIPLVATHGWQTLSETKAEEVLLRFLNLGLNQVLCTDISRDGMMTGPNFALYSMLGQHFPTVSFLASGGLKTSEQVKELQANRVGGAIIGRALYEGTIKLSEVL